MLSIGALQFVFTVAHLIKKYLILLEKVTFLYPVKIYLILPEKLKVHHLLKKYPTPCE